MRHLIPILKMASLKTHLKPQAEFSVNDGVSPHFNTDKLAEFFCSVLRRNFAQSFSVSKRIFWFGFCCFFQSTFQSTLLVCKNSLKERVLHGKGGGYSSSHHQRAVSIPLSFSIILLSALDVQLCPRDRVCSPCVCVCLCGLSLETEV